MTRGPKAVRALVRLSSSRPALVRRGLDAWRRVEGCRVRKVLDAGRTALVELETTRTRMGLLIEAKVLEAASSRRLRVDLEPSRRK